MISFDIRASELPLAEAIAVRAMEMEGRHGARTRTKADWLMDIIATHCNGCPLDLVRFLNADDLNFAHDAFGICRHLDRETGELTDCFLPRFAQTCQGPRPSDPPQLASQIASAAARRRAAQEKRA